MTDADTRQQLAALEQQVRRMRLSIAALAAIIVGLTAGLVETFREQRDLREYGLDTTRIVVTDKGGAHSALGSMKAAPYFKFVDANGTFRLFSTLAPEGPALNLTDSAGKPRLRLSVTDQGGRIELLDANGSARWVAP